MTAVEHRCRDDFNDNCSPDYVRHLFERVKELTECVRELTEHRKEFAARVEELTQIAATWKRKATEQREAKERLQNRLKNALQKIKRLEIDLDRQNAASVETAGMSKGMQQMIDKQQKELAQKDAQIEALKKKRLSMDLSH